MRAITMRRITNVYYGFPKIRSRTKLKKIRKKIQNYYGGNHTYPAMLSPLGANAFKVCFQYFSSFKGFEGLVHINVTETTLKKSMRSLPQKC